MPRYTLLLLLLTGMAVASSCAPEPPRAPVSDRPAAAAPRNQLAEEPTPEALESTNLAPAQGTAETPATGLGDPERFLILARGGPLLLDVWLTIDGRPYGEGLAALIERVLSAGDTDTDGRSTWSEWGDNRVFLAGELANLNPVQERRVRQWIERYDENEDGQMQASEAASWLGRERGRSAAALTLRSRRDFLATSSTHSRLWQLLDADGDRQLGAGEMRLAPERLLRLDTNDDRIIAPQELASLREQLESQSGQRRTFADRSNRPAALHLADHSEASRLDYLLGDLYAPRQQLGPASFSARSRLFAALDLDENQLLDSAELAGMLEIDPHAKLSLDFSSDPESGAAATTLTLLDHAQEFAPIVAPTANRIVLLTEDTRLIVSAHDLSATGVADPIAARSQIRVMVHDRRDALFDALDSNADGKLMEREIAAAADRLRQRDADGNQQLTENELLVSMTVAFLRSEPASEQSFYVPGFDVASVAQQAAAAPAWFRHADFNSDGDLSQSEFLGSTAQFSTLDTNQDGFISGAEADVPPVKPAE